jgi:hypothetical protein
MPTFYSGSQESRRNRNNIESPMMVVVSTNCGEVGLSILSLEIVVVPVGRCRTHVSAQSAIRRNASAWTKANPIRTVYVLLPNLVWTPLPLYSLDHVVSRLLHQIFHVPGEDTFLIVVLRFLTRAAVQVHKLVLVD